MVHVVGILSDYGGFCNEFAICYKSNVMVIGIDSLVFFKDSKANFNPIPLTSQYASLQHSYRG